MKIAVVGSRDFVDYELLKSVLNAQKNGDITAIITGGARGADTLGGRYALEKDIPLIVLKPDWKRLGRSAGFQRNSDIIIAADYVFAFWDGQSHGTRDSIDKAKKLGKPCTIIRI